jgi:enoyl-CoA hydratase
VARIRAFPRPVVAAVNGPAAGVGVSLALACDVTVATESSYFLLAFTKVGLMPDGGATALVAASIGRARALKMALLADRMPATEAVSAGLIAGVYPDDEFASAIKGITDRLATGPADAYRWTKDAIQRCHPHRARQRVGPGMEGAVGTARICRLHGRCHRVPRKVSRRVRNVNS